MAAFAPNEYADIYWFEGEMVGNILREGALVEGVASSMFIVIEI